MTLTEPVARKELTLSVPGYRCRDCEKYPTHDGAPVPSVYCSTIDGDATPNRGACVLGRLRRA